MPFCNPNGIQRLTYSKPALRPIIPFWLQKGMKIAKFCINKIISWKYASRAFKIRSQNVYTTSGYDFMLIFVSAKNGQKRGGALKKKNVTISVRQIFEIPHRSLQLFFAFFWRNFRKDYSRTNRARSRVIAKKKEKFLKNWDISKTKPAMIIIFLIIKTSDFFWISDKKIVSKKYFLASVESLFSNYNHLEICHTSCIKGFLQKRENIFLPQFFCQRFRKTLKFRLLKKLWSLLV